MEPILVPGPPKEAFNKNRRMSDLIKAQVAHMKHIEHSFTPEQREEVPQHPIVTENDAAMYIAAMTHALRGTGAVRKRSEVKVLKPRLVRSGRASAPGSAGTLDIAASASSTAAEERQPSKRKTPRSPAKERR